MTIAKFIECEVAESMRPAFSKSQRSWYQLSDCKGVVGQFGGWDIGNSNAIIVGLWQSHDDVTNFMKAVHDEVANESSQSSTYRKCNVRYFELASTINTPSAGASGANILRIAHCEGVIDEARFLRDQELIWNPAMSKQLGMLGGYLWRSCSNDQNFMVLTFWASIKSHESYCNLVLPELRQKVRLTEYIQNLTGAVVKTERAWDVIPNKTL